MSSAETTHPIEWRVISSGHLARVDGRVIAQIWQSSTEGGPWAIGWADFERPVSYQPTASAARSFVEKSVKEAGHGE